MSNFLRSLGLPHARLPCPSLSLRACSNSCPLSRWCHPTISSTLTPSPPALNLSQHQSFFQWVGSLHQMAPVSELQLQPRIQAAQDLICPPFRLDSGCCSVILSSSLVLLGPGLVCFQGFPFFLIGASTPSVDWAAYKHFWDLLGWRGREAEPGN